MEGPWRREWSKEVQAGGEAKQKAPRAGTQRRHRLHGGLHDRHEDRRFDVMQRNLALPNAGRRKGVNAAIQRRTSTESVERKQLCAPVQRLVSGYGKRAALATVPALRLLEEHAALRPRQRRSCTRRG